MPDKVKRSFSTDAEVILDCLPERIWTVLIAHANEIEFSIVVVWHA